MRRQISFLLAAMLPIFLLGFVSGLAVERSLALNRSTRQALCREAGEARPVLLG
jgi:hypothetical protein